MHQRKSKRILIYFFFLLFVGSVNNINLSKIKINKVENINISGLDILSNKMLLKKIKNLNLENIYLLDGDKIKEIIDSNSLVDEYRIFKNYFFGKN